jgi:transposase-like protein
MIARADSETAAAELIQRWRWPGGVICPKCGSSDIGRIDTRCLFNCNSCQYQFSVRVGTVLSDSKLPLTTWLQAICLVNSGVSSPQLGRLIGVSYKTAYWLRRKILDADWLPV